MRIAEIYSHLNGQEYLLVHHKQVFDEILETIKCIDANLLKTKVSKEKTMIDKHLFSPVELNKAFNMHFRKLGWKESRYQYFVTTNKDILPELIMLPFDKQKEFLIKSGVDNPIHSYKQTDFVKDRIAIEVQFGKYAFVAFDLFVKHLLFFSGGIINVGIEILPMKKLQSEMSSGVAYFEGEVYNILRHGRNNPPSRLLSLVSNPDYSPNKLIT